MPILKSMETREKGLIVLVLILTISYLFSPIQLQFQNNLSERLPIMMGYLLLISLFIERSIEILLSAWRSENADLKDIAIKHIKEDVTHAIQTENANLSSLRDKLKELEVDRSLYSSKSRIYAIWAGLIIGALTSMAGIRALEGIVIVDSDSVNDVQKSIFMLIDISLTATVLAGGSNAINKIMKVYSGFMEATKSRTN